MTKDEPYSKELVALLARAWEQGYAACCDDDELARDKQANPYGEPPAAREKLERKP